MPLTHEAKRFGPYAQRKTVVRLRKPSKWEKANETVQSAGKAVGGLRTVAALGGGAAITQHINDSKDRVRGMASRAIPSSEDQERNVKKSLTIDSILDSRWDPPPRPRMDIDLINKGLTDQEYWDEISKLNLTSPLNAMKKVTPGSWHENMGLFAGGAEEAYKKKGLSGLGTYGRDAFNDFAKPHLSGLNGMSRGQKVAGGAALGAAGTAGLGYGAYRMAKPLVKRKAKKLAIYGGLGIGGTAALGSYMGSRAGG